MKSVWKILLVGFLGIVVGGGLWGYNLFFKSTKAGLLIDTTPRSRVLINGQEVGKTRFDFTTDAGEVTLKLIPISDQELSPFETKLTLVAGVKTVYQRTFSPTIETSSDILISYEKTDLGQASVSVVTNPKNALLIIDGKRQETTPIKLDDLKEGDRSLVITARGFRERSTNVRSKKGYKLTVACSLAKDQEFVEEVSTPIPSVTPQPSTYITILDTPTGFLRVRAEASTLGDEVGQVIPGKQYELIVKDDKTGWYQIKFEGKEGWVSNRYATLATPVPSPIPTPTPTGSI